MTLRLCPTHGTYYHANGRYCPDCGREKLRAVVVNHIRRSDLMSRETPHDEEADYLAAAVADLNDELAGAA